MFGCLVNGVCMCDHAHVRFNHFNNALLVAVRCEASGASEATPAVAEASKASGSYLYAQVQEVQAHMYIFDIVRACVLSVDVHVIGPTLVVNKLKRSWKVHVLIMEDSRHEAAHFLFWKS